MSETARLALPLIEPGQAQKELFHNEALARIDLALHPVVEAVGMETPPPTPAFGQAWALGPAPTGAWAGQGGALAGWTNGGWRFVPPLPGMLIWSLAEALHARWSGSGWTIGSIAAAELRVGGAKVVGSQQAAIANPTGGATVDVQARTALISVLSALRAHGLISG